MCTSSPFIFCFLAQEEGDFPDFTMEDPHDIALLLVRYLTDLPEPLCTFVLYDDFVRCEEEKNVENWIEAMRSYLLQLPDINLRVLKRLINFLCIYASEQQHTFQVPKERTIGSLSNVFAFLTFRSYEEEQGNASFEDTSVSQSLVSKMIINYDALFGTVKEYGNTLSPAVLKKAPIPLSKPSAPICLDKAPVSSISLEKNDVDDSPKSGKRASRARRDKTKKDKKKKNRKKTDDNEDACMMELEMDTSSGPEFSEMCNEVRSQVASDSQSSSKIDLGKSPNSRASYRKKDSIGVKPLPPRPNF